MHGTNIKKKIIVKCFIFLMLKWVWLDIQTQPTFRHKAEVATCSFHQMSLVHKFLKVKIWYHICHTKVPNSMLANNVTNGKKQIKFGKFWGFVSSYGVDRAAQTNKCTTNTLFQHIYLDFNFPKLMWLLTTTLILSHNFIPLSPTQVLWPLCLVPCFILTL
jgi:hypothetical protein